MKNGQGWGSDEWRVGVVNQNVARKSEFWAGGVPLKIGMG